jgi:ferredoxin-NADP reductase
MSLSDVVDRSVAGPDARRAARAAEPELELRVEMATKVSDSVVSLALRMPDGGNLPPWQPGAHIDLILPNGLTRQYSLCGQPEDRTFWRLAVLREPESRGGSSYIHDVLKAGDIVQTRGPRNHFELVPKKAYLFIAGGIGITPILPMVMQVAGEGARWRLAYGGRRRASMAFVDELSGYGDRVNLYPQDECGLFDLDKLLSDVSDDDGVFCCGPNSLITAVEERFRAGAAKGSLYVERFAPLDRPVDGASSGFDVVLGRSGRVVRVAPNETVLDALAGAGVMVPCSCREGICGTCEVAVMRGRPDHRDQVLSEAEKAAGKTMMVCVSRSLDPILELDL